MTLVSNCTPPALTAAVQKLKAGNLVAFATETVYGLGADATNAQAVSLIYQVKGRPSDHPVIVHISSLNKLHLWAINIPEYAIELARNFWPGPMTLILPRSKLAKDFITGGQDNVGLRVPAHPVALELLKQFEEAGGYGIAAPSANRFGAVSPTTAIAVEKEIGQYLSDLDVILDGGPSQVGVESTIISCINELPMILRPGAITKEMIEQLLGVELLGEAVGLTINKIRVPGLLESHYAPKAKVYLSATPTAGDGFIAPKSFSTPTGVIRLAAPNTNEEYAHNLYEALRLADAKGLTRVFAIPPTGGGIAEAVCDRLQRAAYD